MLGSFWYVSAARPALIATIRSGLSPAIWSTGMPLSRFSATGCAPLSLGAAHGHTPKGWSPNQLVTATGTTPRASRSSCSVNPPLTTRLGGSLMMVSPKMCEMLTPPPPALPAAGFDDEHPDDAATTPAPSSPAAPASCKNPRRLHPCLI